MIAIVSTSATFNDDDDEDDAATGWCYIDGAKIVERHAPPEEGKQPH